MELDMSSRGVEKQIRKLREAGVIQRIGADFGGYWEIITKEDKYICKDMLFGNKIKELRDEQGLLQRQLAAFLEIDTPMFS